VRIARLLHPKARVVHRVDGAAEDYGRGAKWDDVQREVNKLAHLTIFQSQYARYATREKFAVIGQDGPVIHNPVNTELFSPLQGERQRDAPPRVVYVSFSTHPNKGADAALQVARDNCDLDFVFVGPLKDRPPFANVRYTGYLKRVDMAELLRSCNFSLFLSKNEACPNVVLEAMAAGLPVLYLDSGATSELVGEAGMAVTPASFRRAFDTIWSEWSRWSACARTRAVEQFSIETVIPNYLQTIKDMKAVSWRSANKPCG
jgi:glycosyltransferase involved in cell wall biosynthesis